MKLDTVQVENFRSIERASLDNCGGFNVLIGKNNAGKSNLLHALNAFFSALSGGRLVYLDPPFCNSIDFHESAGTSRFDITLTFELSRTERDSLIRVLTEHAPQMRKAIEALDPQLRLLVTLAARRIPSAAAYIRRLALALPHTQVGLASTVTHTLLDVSDLAASELIDNYASANRFERISTDFEQLQQSVSRMDADGWASIKAEAEGGRMPLRYLFGARFGHEFPPDVLTTLEAILRRSSTLTDFRSNLGQAISETQEQRESLRRVPLLNKVSTLSGEEVAVPAYVGILMQLLDSFKVLYLTERRNPIGKEEAARLLDLKTRRGGEEKLRNIKSVVSSLLGVEIDAFRSDTPRRGGEEVAELDVDRFLVQANGAGIREALRLILDYEFQRPQLLLVEEPEVHLHPALETSMMHYLRSISVDCQIFITTHSTNFLDTSEMRNVYLVSKPAEATVVESLGIREAESLIPRELGIRLSSLFMFDRLLFVEGRTDEDVLREFAVKLGLNLSQANVGFVHMGGARNFAYFAAETTMSFLTRRRVDVWFLVDRDERDEDELRRLRDLLHNKDRLVVLTKRELENYLTSPTALRRLLELKREFSGTAGNALPELQAIEQELQRAATSLRETTIWRKVLRRILVLPRPDRHVLLSQESKEQFEVRARVELEAISHALSLATSSLADVIAEETGSIDACWSTSAQALAPGDELLDLTMKSFGHRYRKERDAGRLASLMNVDEIHPDIASFLRDVCA